MPPKEPSKPSKTTSSPFCAAPTNASPCTFGVGYSLKPLPHSTYSDHLASIPNYPPKNTSMVHLTSTVLPWPLWAHKSSSMKPHNNAKRGQHTVSTVGMLDMHRSIIGVTPSTSPKPMPLALAAPLSSYLPKSPCQKHRPPTMPSEPPSTSLTLSKILPPPHPLLPSDYNKHKHYDTWLTSSPPPWHRLMPHLRGCRRRRLLPHLRGCRRRHQHKRHHPFTIVTSPGAPPRPPSSNHRPHNATHPRWSPPNTRPKTHLPSALDTRPLPPHPLLDLATLRPLFPPTHARRGPYFPVTNTRHASNNPTTVLTSSTKPAPSHMPPPTTQQPHPLAAIHLASPPNIWPMPSSTLKPVRQWNTAPSSRTPTHKPFGLDRSPTNSAD